jgi:hypothetical protein
LSQHHIAIALMFKSTRADDVARKTGLQAGIEGWRTPGHARDWTPAILSAPSPRLQESTFDPTLDFNATTALPLRVRTSNIDLSHTKDTIHPRATN